MGTERGEKTAVHEKKEVCGETFGFKRVNNKVLSKTLLEEMRQSSLISTRSKMSNLFY